MQQERVCGVSVTRDLQICLILQLLMYLVILNLTVWTHLKNKCARSSLQITFICSLPCFIGEVKAGSGIVNIETASSWIAVEPTASVSDVLYMTVCFNSRSATIKGRCWNDVIRTQSNWLTIAESGEEFPVIPDAMKLLFVEEHWWEWNPVGW